MLSASVILIISLAFVCIIRLIPSVILYCIITRILTRTLFVFLT